LTTQQLTQQELLDLLQEYNARYQKVILHLNDEEQQTAFTPEGWSVKDFLSHMSHWTAATHKVLVAYVHDQPLPPAIASGDEANAKVRETAQELSLPQVRNYWEETHMHLTHLVADELDDKKGQRTGYATRYSENSIAWCHWIGSTVQIRPELRFERAWDRKAYDYGRRQNQLTVASDLIFHF